MKKQLLTSLMALTMMVSMTSCGHEHTYDSVWTNDETYHWHAATCNHSDEVSDKAEHSWDDGVVQKSPTEQDFGEKLLTCSVCQATKVVQIDKLEHVHTFATDAWTKDGTYHWHAATCTHVDEVSDKAEHDYDAGVELSSNDGIKTMKYTCETCGYEKEGTVDTRTYTNSSWETIGTEKTYFYVDNSIVCINQEDLNRDTHYTYTQNNFNLNKTEMSASYKISVNATGTLEAIKQGNASKDIAADPDVNIGVVAWYLDSDNYLVIGAKWTSWDRNEEIRNVYMYGKVAGKKVDSGDSYCDKCITAPVHGITLNIMHVRNDFEWTLTGHNPLKEYTKSGTFTVPGTKTSSSKVGLYAANDRVTFTNFAAENYSPDLKTTYSASIDGVSTQLMVDYATDKFTLTSGDTVKNGTYTENGRKLVLTFEDNTVKYVNVYNQNSTFAYYTPIEVPSDATILEDSTYEVFNNKTGDYKLTFSYLGNNATPGQAVKLHINAWYLDENNYLDFYIEWSASERNHEIRCVQLTGQINGNHAGWNDVWCDGSNILPADGGTFEITKTGTKFTIKLTSGSFVKTAEKDFTQIDADASYAVKMYAENDVFSIYNLTTA